MGYNKEKMIGGNPMTKNESEKDLQELNALDADVIDFSDKEEDDALNGFHDLYDDEDYYDDEACIDFAKESSAGSVTSLVLGIIASLGWMIPVVGLPITIVGIVLGAINLKSHKAKGMAIAGFVINIVFLCVSIAKGIIDIIIYIKKCKR